MSLPRVSIGILDGAEPLHKRAPRTDEHGKAVTDFMMLIPGLRDKPRIILNETMQTIHATLACFPDHVVFAELNLKLNLLWISCKPAKGMRNSIACAIQDRVPGAKLVSHI